MSRGAAAVRHCGLNNQTNNIKILFKDIQVLYVAPSENEERHKTRGSQEKRTKFQIMLLSNFDEIQDPLPLKPRWLFFFWGIFWSKPFVTVF